MSDVDQSAVAAGRFADGALQLRPGPDGARAHPRCAEALPRRSRRAHQFEGVPGRRLSDARRRGGGGVGFLDTDTCTCRQVQVLHG